MNKGIVSTAYCFKHQTGFYRGKVRDVYYIKDRYVVMAATDRISAFDVILPRPIPGKGAILNLMAAHFLNATRWVCPNWLLDVPFPHISIGYKCRPIRVEMVVRGYLAGHAARQYKAGRRELCGVKLPEGMKENDAFPQPIITPTTKAEQGHDEDISREEILKRGLVNEAVYAEMEEKALALFRKGTEMARERGLLLVDTKYEFGLLDGKLMVMDEIHTPDSSRYFYREGYEERQRQGLPQRQLSKEFVREWLMENGFQGKEGQAVPEMTGEKVWEIRKRYEELYSVMLGKPPELPDFSDEEVEEKINDWVDKLKK
jgi:phosphoribosylaminoimidazole-succinocarboxamide synthase